MSDRASTSGKATWRQATANGREALRRSWGISRPLTTALIGTALVLALVPASLAVLSGVIVSRVEKNLGEGETGLGNLSTYLVLAAVLILTGGLCEVIQQYARRRLGDQLNLRLSKEVIDHACTLDFAFFELPENYDLLTRAIQYPGRDFLVFVTSIVRCGSLSVQFLSLLGVMMWIEPLVTPLLALVMAPFLAFRWFLTRLRFSIHRAKTAKRRRTRYYVSKLTRKESIPTVKLFNLGPLMSRRFEETIRELMDVDRGLYRKEAVGRAVVTVTFSIIFLFAAGWVTMETLTGGLGVGLLVTYLASAIRFRNCNAVLINTVSTLLEKSLFVQDLKDFFAVRPTMVGMSSPVPLDVRGRITLKNVSFNYPGVAQAAIRDVSLDVQPGETVALVGANGAGKTTLARLMARLYDASEGEVLIDGRNVRDLDVDLFYGQVAFVGQQFTRFEATVEENIAYGDWQRLIDRPEEIVEIARRAGIEPLLCSLPDGLKTVLGRRFGDYDLSGGQWQQIAIARALAKKAPILILDEPTSNLDVQSELDIFGRFQRLARDRTTILITHRFSTVKMADRIFVLDEGRIVESGTHDQLQRQNGLYANLYRIHETSLPGSGPATVEFSRELEDTGPA